MSKPPESTPRSVQPSIKEQLNSLFRNCTEPGVRIQGIDPTDLLQQARTLEQTPPVSLLADYSEKNQTTTFLVLGNGNLYGEADTTNYEIDSRGLVKQIERGPVVETMYSQYGITDNLYEVVDLEYDKLQRLVRLDWYTVQRTISGDSRLPDAGIPTDTYVYDEGRPDFEYTHVLTAAAYNFRDDSVGIEVFVPEKITVRSFQYRKLVTLLKQSIQTATAFSNSTPFPIDEVLTAAQDAGVSITLDGADISGNKTITTSYDWDDYNGFFRGYRLTVNSNGFLININRPGVGSGSRRHFELTRNPNGELVQRKTFVTDERGTVYPQTENIETRAQYIESQTYDNYRWN